MKNFKNKKYLLLDLDGVCYGKHNNYSLERVFGQVSKRMTMFISEKLKIDMNKAKELQTNYFYKYNTSLKWSYDTSRYTARGILKICSHNRSFIHERR